MRLLLDGVLIETDEADEIRWADYGDVGTARLYRAGKCFAAVGGVGLERFQVQDGETIKPLEGAP